MTVLAKQIVGRRIVGFEPGVFDGAHGTIIYPQILLDDGSVLVFSTQQHDTGYGVQVIRHDLKRSQEVTNAMEQLVNRVTIARAKWETAKKKFHDRQMTAFELRAAREELDKIEEEYFAKKREVESKSTT